MPATVLVRFAVLALLAGGPDKPLPDFRAEGGGAQPDGSARLEKAGVVVRVRYLNDTERLAALRRVAGLEHDPFAIARDRKSAFRTLLLEVENHGDIEALVHPGFVRVKAVDEVRAPHGFVTLYSFLHATVSDDAALARLAVLLGDTSFPVAPGARAEKLLVFQDISLKAKVWWFTLDDVRLGAEDWDVAAKFRRVN